MKIFRAFKQTKNEKEFCQVHYLNLRHMQFAVEVRKQLMELCRRNEIPVQSCANHTDLVRKALAEGLFTNVAKLTRDGHYVTVSDTQCGNLLIFLPFKFYVKSMLAYRQS